MKKVSWKGKRVLILGLGQYPKGSGISAALYALKQGAEVCVTDHKTAKELEGNVKILKAYPGVRYRLGGHDLRDIDWADIVIRNPRVRYSSPEMVYARKQGKQIESAESLFFKACPCPIIGITGTRGKSTTTTLVYEMLAATLRKGRVWLGGNILIAPLSFLSRVRSTDLVVLELSSFQLEAIGEAGYSPSISCLTNLLPDHLNAYEDMAAYGEAKAQIFRHQRPDDILIVNGDDAFCRSAAVEAPGIVRQFTQRQKKTSDAWITPTALMLKEGAQEITVIEKKKLWVGGDHIYRNMCAAALTARAAGASIAAIRKALQQFRGLPDRQEVIAQKKGVLYVNDTTATTPDAVMAALQTFAQPKRTIRLILGGADKVLVFDELAHMLRRVRVDIVVLPGTAHVALTRALRSAAVPYADVATLEEALQSLESRAHLGDVILLSPGCASFGLFENEFARGAAFRRLVQKMV